MTSNFSEWICMKNKEIDEDYANLKGFITDEKSAFTLGFVAAIERTMREGTEERRMTTKIDDRGICPRCGGDNLSRDHLRMAPNGDDVGWTYGCDDCDFQGFDDYNRCYRYMCNYCGFRGIERCEITFVRHLNRDGSEINNDDEQSP